jgi:hypothetical protein
MVVGRVLREIGVQKMARPTPVQSKRPLYTLPILTSNPPKFDIKYTDPESSPF